MTPPDRHIGLTSNAMAAAHVRSVGHWYGRTLPGVVRAILLTVTFVVTVTPVSAQSGDQVDAPRIGTDAPRSSEQCVQVDIAGYRAGHIDCATLRLREAARAAQARAPNAADFDAPDARSADVVTGVASRTATRQRLGNQFGIGVRPQRPAPMLPPQVRGPRP